jgi:translation initiation factor 1
MRLFEGTEFYQPPRCDRCQALVEVCECPPPPVEKTPPEKQTARVQVEKRKKGKVVTVIRGLAEGNPDHHFSDLLTKLKNACGAGGTIQENTIEIQGNHKSRIEGILKEIGFRIKG